jgi:hypothetical protein
MISTNHKDEMHVATNKANQEGTKPAETCDYTVNISGVNMMDQMLQLYLLEKKKGTMWYLILLNRLLSVAIHNANAKT